MICKSCGTDVPGSVKFCTSCGSPMEQPAAPPPPPAPAPAYTPPVQPADARPPKGSPYAPISTFGYIGYFILFSIPLIGQILCIVWAFSKKPGNVNRRGLARAFFIFLIIGIIMGVASWILVAKTTKLVSSGIVSEAPGGSASVLGGLGGLFNAFGKNAGKDNPEGKTQAPAAGEYNFGEGTLFPASWPQNEFTKQVPKPDFEVAFGGSDESSFTVVFSNVSIEQLRVYAAKVKKAGFNKNVDTTDENMWGMTTYSYKADNNKGYHVEIGSALGMNAISISKR